MTIAAHLPALQVVVPLLVAPLALLLAPRGLAWLAAASAALAAFAIAVALCRQVLAAGPLSYAVGGWQAPYGIELYVDEFSVLLLLLVNGASALTLLACRASVDRDIEPHRQPMFYAAWLLATAGMSGIAATGDAFNVFVFMEVASLASYVLIAAGPDRRALPAVFKYLVMGTIGATFYLIGIALVYMMTGTLNLADMEARIREVQDLKPILVAAGFITIGLALKAAVFPLHTWLPNAYTWAPHAVTAMLAACSTKVALYVLLHFDFFVFQGNLAQHDRQFGGFLMPLAVLAILVASTVAMRESHLKRMLAFSSIAQVGYILLGASLVSVGGLSAAMLHMFNHALAKGALFLAVMCLGLRLADLDLRALGGIGRAMPWTMAAFALASLSLIGVPGTAGFVSKWYLLQAAFAHGGLGVPLLIVILVSSLMSVVYLGRVLEQAYFGSPPQGGAAVREAPAWMLAMVWLAALANLWFGLRPGLPLALADGGAQALLRHLQ